MRLSAIRDDVDFLCGSTSASYPTTAKNRNINIAYADVARLIWESDNGWQYDDSNATTLPVGYATLVHDQQDYELPSTAQVIHQVEVKDSNGDWFKLDPWDPRESTTADPEVADNLGNPGLPLYYDLVGRSIKLYPRPASGSCTLVSGLAVYVDRDVTEITAASATPGFATPFHRILSYAAAIDFVQDEQARKNLISQRARLENGMIRFYSKRATETKTTIKPASKKNWRQYQ